MACPNCLAMPSPWLWASLDVCGRRVHSFWFTSMGCVCVSESIGHFTYDTFARLIREYFILFVCCAHYWCYWYCYCYWAVRAHFPMHFVVLVCTMVFLHRWTIGYFCRSKKFSFGWYFVRRTCVFAADNWSYPTATAIELDHHHRSPSTAALLLSLSLALSLSMNPVPTIYPVKSQIKSN